MSVLEHARKSVKRWIRLMANGQTVVLEIAYRARAKMLATPARARPATPPAMEVEAIAAPELPEVEPVALGLAGAPVPFKVSARETNAAWLREELSSALTEKTIPFPQ